MLAAQPSPLTMIHQDSNTTSITNTSNNDNGNLWTHILSSVAKNKSSSLSSNSQTSSNSTSKNIVLLGDLQSGKSTILQALKASSLSDLQLNLDGVTPQSSQSPSSSLGLGYDYIELKDEDDTPSRISVYHLAANPEYTPLFQFALTPQNIFDTCIVITLDWQRPWDFLSSLEKWLQLVEQRIVELVASNPDLEARWEEAKAILESYIRNYVEPISESQQSEQSSSQQQQQQQPSQQPQQPSPFLNNVILPLPPGTLTKNLGLPIMIVCTKSDHMSYLDREKEYKEETFDFIQQSLRTVALHYGASLVFTSSQRTKSATFLTVRDWVLRRLGVSAAMTKTKGTDIIPQVIERDTVVIPSGWDSFGKIRALRDFDCEYFIGMKRRSRSPSQQPDNVEEDPLHHAVAVYESIIQRLPSHTSFPPVLAPSTLAEDDQTFLERQLGLLGSVENQQPLHSQSVQQQQQQQAQQQVPTKRDLEEMASKLAKLQQQAVMSSSTSANTSASAGSVSMSKLMPPAVNGAPAASGAGQINPTDTTQTEVLANFFQSLLNKKSQSNLGGGK